MYQEPTPFKGNRQPLPEGWGAGGSGVTNLTMKLTISFGPIREDRGGLSGHMLLGKFRRQFISPSSRIQISRFELRNGPK